MSTSSTAAVVEHAHDRPSSPNRDEIVLSADEVRRALAMAVDTPHYALTALAERDALGLTTSARLRAVLAEAAGFVYTHGLADKPAPTVTHVHTERVLPPIETDAHGDRVLDGPGYGFVWVESPDPSAPADEPFEPHLVVEGIVRESDLDGFRADTDRFTREIAKPVESSWNRVAS